MDQQARALHASNSRYGPGAVAFHWFMAPLLVVVGVLGLLHDSWPKQTQAFWINMHALCGLLLWFTLMWRFSWRARHAPPALPADIGVVSRRLSAPVHLGLYALMFITPILGIITFIWHGRILDAGLFHIDFGIRKNPAIFEPTEDIHGYLAYALFVLAGLHIVAALWHQFVLRDGVMGRMWPRRSAERGEAPLESR
ncbi:MAG TPA: cytochrome b/b6 domain-containing protein [Steroidobacteraceae bacterium]|jgi:cytochrome b561|nr:cytochrome b/b6 domain-containing protein [Steroidobacteraceae bacterium]